MTRQEKIREELPHILEGVWLREDYDNVWVELTKVALEYLHSQGGVLKVERKKLPEIHMSDEEIPNVSATSFFAICDLARKSYKEAGYEATESLIKE